MHLDMSVFISLWVSVDLYNAFFEESTVICKICGFELLFEKTLSI